MAIPISPSERHASVSIRRLGQEQVIEIRPANLKAVRRSGHIQTPYTVRLLPRNSLGLYRMILQSPRPVPQCESVMLAQTFNVSDFESTVFRHPQTCVNWYNIPIRKHIAVDE